jgi:hypothetical protein
MATSVQGYAANKVGVLSRLSPILRRVPLVMVTVIFTMISVRYLSDPVRAAAKVGISFTQPSGITVARVGFAGFPLAIAILTFSCLISSRRLLAGQYLVLTVVGVVTVVRIFGIALDHSTASARLLIPETVLLILSLIAIRLESALRREQARA